MDLEQCSSPKPTPPSSFISRSRGTWFIRVSTLLTEHFQPFTAMIHDENLGYPAASDLSMEHDSFRENGHYLTSNETKLSSSYVY